MGVPERSLLSSESLPASGLSMVCGEGGPVHEGRQTREQLALARWGSRRMCVWIYLPVTNYSTVNSPWVYFIEPE